MAGSAADELVLDQVTGELAPAAGTKLQAHLHVCMSCRARSGRMRKVVELTDCVLRHRGGGAVPGAAAGRRRMR